MKITHYDERRWPSVLETADDSFRAELTVKEDDFEFTIKVTEYGCCSSYETEKSVFLSIEDALELANFIIEECKAIKK